ncbi:MAG: PilC/PilY family type IV pilus protein [Rubrivivax sp.]|nr:PilC/PilY family type IV pilus protein [Rubrivivax sp.]
MTISTRSIHRLGLACKALLATLALLAAGPAFTQTINDVPMAVKNNVAPNFMFMIDNSGSMSNIVPTTPYNPAVDYSPSGCSGANVLGNGSQIDIRVSGNKPYFRVGSSGTDYSHWTATTSNRRCFAKTTTYDARLLGDNSGIPGNYLPSEYTGNYLNWYFGDGGDATKFPLSGWGDRKKTVPAGSVQTRLEIAKASATSVIGGLPVSSTQPLVRLGLSTYNNGDGGTLLRGMADFDTTQRTNMLSSINGLSPSGNTPLAETLADIGRYMATGWHGNITAGTVTGVSIGNFLKQDGRVSCLNGANCATSTSDAIPASPSIGTISRPIQYWCQRSYAFMMTDGRSQGDQAFTNNTYLRDYDRDCSGPLAGNCSGGYDRKSAREYETQGSDYLDDVAKALFDVDLRPNLPSPDPILRPKQNNLLTYTIGFADAQVQNDPLLINTAKQGGGLFLSAQDGASLTTAFNKVIADAFSKDAAAAAVAVANAQITLNNIGYASSYKSGAWYGDLVAYSLNTTSALQTGGDLWSLREKLDLQGTNRKIATYNGSAGVPFVDTLSYAGMPASLTAGVINYLRGDRSAEGSTYRSRQSVLGDIINAEPVVVNYGGNVPIIFQGANDGMLHVVDGRTDAAVATRGQELWAYVPKMLHAGLGGMVAPDYGLVSPNYTHRYYIDGTPATAEVSGLSFTRLLVGGLGKGGRGYYALDISSYEAINGAAVASKVLWEFSPVGMGYSFGTPLIVKTAAGWRVVVSSGYAAGVSGRVWVLDPSSGAVLAEIDTGVGNAGLAHLSRLANTAPDALVRYVWGGDLQGNVWRFDLDNGTAMKIAALTDTGGTLVSPITAPPEVGAVAGSSTKFMVHVGTGQYLADADVPGPGQNTHATQRQSIYGLIDDTTIVVPVNALIGNVRGSNGGNCPAGGGDGSLVCQTLTYVGATNTYSATAHPVDTATRRGWYIDLPVDAQMNNGRVVSKPALTTGGTLTLTVNIPTNVQCDPGGRSWFLALNGATGGAVPINVGGNTYHESVGFFLGYALASRPVIVTSADGKRALIRMSDKTVNAPPVPEAASTAAQWRRIYWRQVN